MSQPVSLTTTIGTAAALSASTTGSVSGNGCHASAEISRSYSTAAEPVGDDIGGRVQRGPALAVRAFGEVATLRDLLRRARLVLDLAPDAAAVASSTSLPSARASSRRIAGPSPRPSSVSPMSKSTPRIGRIAGVCQPPPQGTVARRVPPGGVAAVEGDETGLDVGTGRHGDLGADHAVAAAESCRVRRCVRRLAELAVEMRLDSACAREVPRVHEHVGRERTEHLARRALTASRKVGRAVERAVGLEAPNNASAVARQRAAGSSRGRLARMPSGRRMRNSWNPITCSTSARVPLGARVGASHIPASNASATPRTRHPPADASPPTPPRPQP